MDVFRNDSAPYERCVEWLFARLEDQPEGQALPLRAPGRPALPNSLTPPQAFPPLPQDWPQQPPALDTPEGLRNAYEWFRAERRRLDESMQGQLAAVQQKHYDVLAQHYRSEAEMVRREQDVNRELRLLTTQAEALRERARGLAEWEEALSAQATKLAALQQEHLAGRQLEGGASPGEQACLASLEALRAEASQRRPSEAAARAKFEAMEGLLKERQAAWEKQQAAALVRQQHLERRCRELERAEEALARRAAELDEVADRLLETPEEERVQTLSDPSPVGRG